MTKEKRDMEMGNRTRRELRKNKTDVNRRSMPRTLRER